MCSIWSRNRYYKLALCFAQIVSKEKTQARCCVINEVIMGENHWGSNPGAHLITNFLPKVSLPFPTFTLHHFREEMECNTIQDI